MTVLMWVVLIGLVFAAVSALASWRARTRLLARIRREWGSPRVLKRDMDAIADFFRSQAATPSLDDRTWSDLLMDDVFALAGPDREQHRATTSLSPASPGGRPAEFSGFRSARPACGAGSGRARTRADSARAPSRLRGLLPPSPGLSGRPGAPAVARPVSGVDAGHDRGVDARLRGSRAPLRGPHRLHREFRHPCRHGPAHWSGSCLVPAAGPADVLSEQALLALADEENAAITSSMKPDLASLGRLGAAARWLSRDPLVAGDLAGVVFEFFNVLLLLDANAMYFASRALQSVTPRVVASHRGRRRDRCGHRGGVVARGH